jgi:hypothetical protein
MTDHIPNDLSHLSEEEFNSLCPQGEHAPGPAPLSPAAQAIFWAFNSKFSWIEDGVPGPQFKAIAAALRVVVDQVTPVSTNLRQTKIRYELVAIADELDGQ